MEPFSAAARLVVVKSRSLEASGSESHCLTTSALPDWYQMLQLVLHAHTPALEGDLKPGVGGLCVDNGYEPLFKLTHSKGHKQLVSFSFIPRLFSRQS